MLTIGLVNNMPPAAIASTERQFTDLLTAAADGLSFKIEWFRISGARPRHYRPLDDLWTARIDGLIVTGAEPRAATLTEEPFWAPLAQLVDWAAVNTASTIWSCLAAHAAVLHLDGIDRRAKEQKIFGIFAARTVTEHPILPGLSALWQVPHSRWNDLIEDDLARCGYTVLLKSEQAGVDTFIKHVGTSLFVFIQSHPEYGTGALMREYQRDVARFENGQLDRPPEQPQNHLAALDDWKEMAVRLYRNWLYLLQSQKASERMPA